MSTKNTAVSDVRPMIECRWHGPTRWDGRSWRCLNDRCRAVVETVGHPPTCPGEKCGVELVSRECPLCVQATLKYCGKV